jgi:D-alanyl-D-alanine carboxypeptidase
LDAHSWAAEGTRSRSSQQHRIVANRRRMALGVLVALMLAASTACSTQLESIAETVEAANSVSESTSVESPSTSSTSTTTTSTTTSTTTTTTSTTVVEVIPRPAPAVDWARFEQSLFDALPRSTEISAAMVYDGEVIWTATRGQADTESRFRIASLSKILTAIVVMQLVEEGRVGLDEPIGQLVADQLGLGPVPPSAAALTPSMLLSHRSGFDKYRTLFFSGPRQGDFRSAAATGLRQGPGRNTSFVYSNMNYVIAGVLIEALTGQSYEAAVTERLLAPLGIDTMRLAGTHDVQPGEIRHVSGPDRNYMELLGPAGAWVGSAGDMARILDSISSGGLPADAGSSAWRSLGPEAWMVLVEPLSFGPLEAGTYGRGVMYDAIGAFGHTGSIENTRTMGMVLPNGLVYTVLINAKSPDRASAIGERVRAALASAT